jgi:methylenetetrahydrofolate--tRNA-(uracil-5-)-methyltransferase
MNSPKVRIVGGGLAGSEAAWQLAKRGHQVRLYEMRPQRKSEAHQTGNFAELVCSNSLRGADLKNAVGLLKEEMRRLDSLVMRAADRHAVPGGGALVVDRVGFSDYVTRTLRGHPCIEVVNEEVVELNEASASPLLVATGPLTSPALAEGIRRLTGSEYLYFYDSIAPIVEADSIDLGVVFRASRYGKGEADYLNCPLNREEYEVFVAALVQAEKVPTKDFEQAKFFEGCLPVEVMAERGRDTLAFGPMKPVGLTDPRSGRRPYAVVQLRQDNLHATLYNMVGFQTRMKYPEQKRIFRMIPGLEGAEFVRLGSMHRNTFLNSPALLNEQLELQRHPGIFLAGQMIGVEGYVESAAMGLYAGIVLQARLEGREIGPPPPVTALGALVRHVTRADPREFQPMNVNFGLLDIPPALSRKERRVELAQRALSELEAWRSRVDSEVGGKGALAHAAGGSL